MAHFQDLSQFRVSQGFRGRSGAYVQLWWFVQATFIRMSPHSFYGWRVFWLRLFGARIGAGVKIRPSARFTYPWKVEIGDHCWVGDRAELYSLERISIGRNVCISQDCYVCTGSHDMSDVSFSYDCQPIEIEDEVWIAAGSFICPGVRIGAGAVVAARSVVTRSLDSGKVFAGQPARMLRRREQSPSTNILS